MKRKHSSEKQKLNYFAVLKGVKLPWLLILLSTVFSLIMMRAELQVATLTADIIDVSQKAINGSKLVTYISMAVISAVGTDVYKRQEKCYNIQSGMSHFYNIICILKNAMDNLFYVTVW